MEQVKTMRAGARARVSRTALACLLVVALALSLGAAPAAYGAEVDAAASGVAADAASGMGAGTACRAPIARFGEDCVLPQDVQEPMRFIVFIVSFSTGTGRSAAPRYFLAGQPAGELPVPVRTGHTFLGWHTAPSGGTKVTASTRVTADVTYYAQWRADTYPVRFDANGGKVSGKAAVSVKRSYGSTLGKVPTPVRTGYTFLGWYAGKVKGMRVGAATKVTKATTYYAHWKAKGPVVTLDANGGKVGKAATASVVRTKGKAVGRLATPVRTGYSFLGWYTGKVKGTKVTAATKATRNFTLYAHWKKAR
jgi:uncharacterized repeat protein (TIGR02543 family)